MHSYIYVYVNMHGKHLFCRLMILTDVRTSQMVFGMQSLLDEHEYFLSNLNIPLDALPCFDPNPAVPLFRLVLLFVYSLVNIASTT